MRLAATTPSRIDEQRLQGTLWWGEPVPDARERREDPDAEIDAMDAHMRDMLDASVYQVGRSRAHGRTCACVLRIDLLDLRMDARTLTLTSPRSSLLKVAQFWKS